MQITNYVFFDGCCAEAFGFYAQLLGGRIESLMRGGEAPGGESMSAEARNKVMYARLDIGNQTLMGSDWMAERPFEAPQGFYVSLNLDNQTEAERIYTVLAAQGEVRVALAPTFFAARFAMLVDRFGIPWMIICRAAG